MVACSAVWPYVGFPRVLALLAALLSGWGVPVVCYRALLSKFESRCGRREDTGVSFGVGISYYCRGLVYLVAEVVSELRAEFGSIYQPRAPPSGLCAVSSWCLKEVTGARGLCRVIR